MCSVFCTIFFAKLKLNDSRTYGKAWKLAGMRFSGVSLLGIADFFLILPKVFYMLM